MKNKVDVSYYEKNDFSKLMEDSMNKKIIKSPLKRITINITDKIYKEAQELDQFMNMGYQNVLKTAILFGLNDLEKVIITRKDYKKALKKKELHIADTTADNSA
jgi:Pyruvate/2-oxoacid:ferredoxin oxidoreductase gamma subunit